MLWINLDGFFCFAKAQYSHIIEINKPTTCQGSGFLVELNTFTEGDHWHKQIPVQLPEHIHW